MEFHKDKNVQPNGRDKIIETASQPSQMQLKIKSRNFILSFTMSEIK